MKILVAEYAVGADVPEFLLEGRAMLSTLVKSFGSCGHEVIYPTAGERISDGVAIKTERFEEALATLSRTCDAGLVIAPDEILGDLTDIVEEHTVNLGCPPESVRLCADKLECSRALEKKNIPVPETLGSGEYRGDYVVKPRFGCASEGLRRSTSGFLDETFIATSFIEGEHLSASVISGRTQLPLTVNRQFIALRDTFSYQGGMVPYVSERNDEIMEIAARTAKVLGCRGYVGVDIVLGDKPYVVDVNPRPTTSIIGIAKVLDGEIADLILKARFGVLPQKVMVHGTFTFSREDLLMF